MHGSLFYFYLYLKIEPLRRSAGQLPVAETHLYAKGQTLLGWHGPRGGSHVANVHEVEIVGFVLYRTKGHADLAYIECCTHE